MDWDAVQQVSVMLASAIIGYVIKYIRVKFDKKK